jgi:hypothetical protein
VRGAVLAVAVIACGLVAATSQALGTAGKHALKGPLDRGGEVVIKVSRGEFDGTTTRKYEWTFDPVQVRCSGKWRVARFPVTGGMEINIRYEPKPGESWGISGTGAEGPHGTYGDKVAGRLVTHAKARGWVRVHGTGVPLRGGGFDDCDSGRLHWVARR